MLPATDIENSLVVCAIVTVAAHAYLTFCSLDCEPPKLCIVVIANRKKPTMRYFRFSLIAFLAQFFWQFLLFLNLVR